MAAGRQCLILIGGGTSISLSPLNSLARSSSPNSTSDSRGGQWGMDSRGVDGTLRIQHRAFVALVKAAWRHLFHVHRHNCFKIIVRQLGPLGAWDNTPTPPNLCYNVSAASSWVLTADLPSQAQDSIPFNGIQQPQRHSRQERGGLTDQAYL